MGSKLILSVKMLLQLLWASLFSVLGEFVAEVGIGSDCMRREVGEWHWMD